MDHIGEREKKKKAAHHRKLQLLQWAFKSTRAMAAREQMEAATESELCRLLSLSGDLTCKIETTKTSIMLESS